MKVLFKLLIVGILFPASTFAKSKTCANLDYSAKAKITERYIDVILLRRLHRVEIEGETVFWSWWGKADDSNPFEEGGYTIEMFSGGILISNDTVQYKLACRAPKEYSPGSKEHEKHIENWKYLFE